MRVQHRGQPVPGVRVQVITEDSAPVIGVAGPTTDGSGTMTVSLRPGSVYTP